MNQRKIMKLNTRNAWTAQVFLLPFYLGVIFFFATPLFSSIRMSFSDVSVSNSGFVFTNCGFKNYNFALFRDANFTTNLVKSLVNISWQVPTINVFAIFLALIINQKFKGRTFVRAIFFLPIVFASSIAFSIIQGDTVASAAMSSSDVSGGNISTGVIQELLVNSNLNSEIVEIINTLSNSLFSLAWASGVQMLLYLAGLQSVSPTLYEASSIEGASAWENFWKITFPMLSPIMVVCIVYTVVDNFTNTENSVMRQIVNVSIMDLTKMGMSAAFAWIYFLIILLTLGIVALIYYWLIRDKKGGNR